MAMGPGLAKKITWLPPGNWVDANTGVITVVPAANNAYYVAKSYAINRELAPAEDQGVLFAFVNAPEHTNLDYLSTYTDKLTETFLAVPEKQNLFAINGFPNSHSAWERKRG